VVWAEDVSAVRAQFLHPPREYATVPLWDWNDMLTEEEIRSSLRDLAGQSIRQAMVHPRPGLMTPYLSDEWFRLWKIALDEAEKLDMNIWIYDENSYPSGFAGGWVPELMPEARDHRLEVFETAKPEQLDKNILGVYRITEKGYENVTAQLRGGKTPPEGKYYVARKVASHPSPWTADRTYVDLMRPGVAEKFLEVTLEPYRKRFGDQYGKRVPGSFSDEPNLQPGGGIGWSDFLPPAFENRWGYSLLDHLPSLFFRLGDWRKVRHDCRQTMHDLFVMHWSMPYSEYCEKHHLEYTGHYYENEWPYCPAVPDVMAMYAWHSRPGIDCLFNQYSESCGEQYGNVRIVKELSSVANQFDRKRTLCEAYGASGWDLRLEDMKRIGDWLYCFGVNTLDEHLSYITIRGARKRDHPQSFSYHEPWWEAYHVMAEYFTRLSLALSSGKEVNRILVIEPTTTTWLYRSDPASRDHLTQIGDRFAELLVKLSKAQVEYDLGSENLLARFGKAADDEKGRPLLFVKNRGYHTVVIAPMTETLGERAVAIVEAFAKQGGRVLCCGEPPSMVDARPSDRGKKAATSPNWRQVEASELPDILAADAADSPVKIRFSGGLLYHYRRQLEGGNFLFLINVGTAESTQGTISTLFQGVQLWDAMNGSVHPYPFRKADGVKASEGIQADFDLPPGGSLLLYLSEDGSPETPKVRFSTRTLNPTSPPTIRRLTLNVLPLDYVGVTAGGETLKNVYFYRANHFVFQKNGMARNPWDSGVQFKDEILKHQFPAESGFVADYRFTIEEQVPKDLEVVVERPDLYEIKCNDKVVTAKKGVWWLDKCFGRIDLGGAAKVGENSIALRAKPMTLYHELEPVHIRGDFSLKALPSGFAVVPPKPLKLGAADPNDRQPLGWNRQGHPFYGEGVGYREKFDVSDPSGTYFVRLPSWYGSVAKVTVNGQFAGYITHQPWRCDVSKFLKQGENTVETIVVGTLKNTLGPHHSGMVRGMAWPTVFHQAPEAGPPPGEQYDTIGYGLFEPFVLEQEK
jgi:hypothetical protein